MNEHRILLESATLSRVSYADVTVPPEVVGLTAGQVAGVPWSAPRWAEGDQVRVGAAAWFADMGGKRLVFDPLQAADGVLRADRAAEAGHQSAVAHVFASAGFARESIDFLVMSHIEGVGMIAWRGEDGRWSPYFPNARVLISDVALREFRAAGDQPAEDMQHAAWQALMAAGVVDTFTDGEVIVPGLTAEVKGGHCPGHAVLHFGLRGESPAVTMLGHLAVSPLHLVTGDCPQLHADPALAWSLLHAQAEDGRTLVGPLWPGPGCGRWVNGAVEA